MKLKFFLLAAILMSATQCAAGSGTDATGDSSEMLTGGMTGNYLIRTTTCENYVKSFSLTINFVHQKATVTIQEAGTQSLPNQSKFDLDYIHDPYSPLIIVNEDDFTNEAGDITFIPPLLMGIPMDEEGDINYYLEYISLNIHDNPGIVMNIGDLLVFGPLDEDDACFTSYQHLNTF